MMMMLVYSGGPQSSRITSVGGFSQPPFVHRRQQPVAVRPCCHGGRGGGRRGHWYHGSGRPDARRRCDSGRDRRRHDGAGFHGRMVYERRILRQSWPLCITQRHTFHKKPSCGDCNCNCLYIYIYIFIRSKRAASKKTNDKSNNKQTLTKQTDLSLCGFYRASAHWRAILTCNSVRLYACPSVCPSRSGILWKRLNILS